MRRAILRRALPRTGLSPRAVLTHTAAVQAHACRRLNTYYVVISGSCAVTNSQKGEACAVEDNGGHLGLTESRSRACAAP